MYDNPITAEGLLHYLKHAENRTTEEQEALKSYYSYIRTLTVGLLVILIAGLSMLAIALYSVYKGVNVMSMDFIAYLIIMLIVMFIAPIVLVILCRYVLGKKYFDWYLKQKEQVNALC